MDQRSRASSCPTPRRTGSRRTLSWTCSTRSTRTCTHALVTPSSHPGSWFWIVRHSTLGPGVHASLQELDPQRGGQTLRRALGSRVQLRTCQSGLHHIGAPTTAALIRAHSSTERRQPATSNRWLALHRLERGGAA